MPTPLLAVSEAEPSRGHVDHVGRVPTYVGIARPISGTPLISAVCLNVGCHWRLVRQCLIVRCVRCAIHGPASSDRATHGESLRI